MFVVSEAQHLPSLSQLSDMTNGTLLGDDGNGGPLTVKDQLPLGVGDMGGGLMEGFGAGDGGMMDIGEMPNVSDLTLDHLGNQTNNEMGDKEPTPMEIDQINEQTSECVMQCLFILCIVHVGLVVSLCYTMLVVSRCLSLRVV